MFGVGTRSDPRQPIQSFMSSTEMKRTFGCDLDAAAKERIKVEGVRRRRAAVRGFN